MVAVRLTPPSPAIMVASPDYIGRRGAPAAIGELRTHNCIGYRLIASQSVYPWDLREDGRKIGVEVGGTVRVTDATYARELALLGVGIAYLFEPLVREDLAAGRLRQVLPESAIEEPGLFLYFPRHGAEAPKLRAFIDALRELPARSRSAP
jgi:DNA-binding transcriptional LysR family regulator